MLAGKGFDRWPEWPRNGRALRWFVGLAILWILVVLGLIELAVQSTVSIPISAGSASTSRLRWPGVVQGFERVFQSMPWSGDPSFPGRPPSFAEVMAGARRPVDPHVQAYLPLAVVLQNSVTEKIFTNQRGWIYLGELGETAVLLILLWVVAGMSQGRQTSVARAALILVTLLDLWVLGRHRLIDVAPMGPLTGQSPLLARLAEEPRGTRIADPLKNLSMRVGLAPIDSYRTLDLPAVKGLTGVAMGPMNGPEFEARVKSAMRVTGTTLRVFSPLENRINHFLGRPEPKAESIDDPELARWLYGGSWADAQGDWVERFSIWRSPEPPVRAWYLPLTGNPDETILDEWTGNLEHILTLFHRAEALEAESEQPDDWTIRVWAKDPGWVIVSQLHDPQWTAHWIGMEGQGEREMEILPAFPRGANPGAGSVSKSQGKGSGCSDWFMSRAMRRKVQRSQ